MNIAHRLYAALLPASVALAVLLGIDCRAQEPTPAPAAKSATAERASVEKNSFHEVTAQLDPGGSLYAYLSTEQWLAGLSTKIASFRSVVDSLPNVSGTDKKNILRVFDVVTSLVKNSGIEDVSGFGISSIAREPGFYHSKFVMHHYRDKGAGYLWSLFGVKPHPLDGLNWMPDTSVIGVFSDLDLSVLWTAITEQAGKLGVSDAKAALAEGTGKFTALTGLKLDEVLASLGNEFGFAITLDESKAITLPIPDHPLTIPEPGIMLAIKVRNDLIFNRVDELLKDNPMVSKSEKDGARMRTLQIPLPVPSLRPTLARVGDYLFVTTSDALVTDMMAVKAGTKPGIKSTAEFKKLSAETPAEGNEFVFVSKRFGETFLKLQAQLVANNPDADAQARVYQKLFNPGGSGHQFEVRVVGGEGIVATMNGNQDQTRVMLVPAVAVAGLLAAIAIPNFIHARATAQQNACINNLRMIDAAKQQWALENKKAAGDTPTWSEITPYLDPKANDAILICPAHGTYEISTVATPPTCSIPGHALPE